MMNDKMSCTKLFIIVAFSSFILSGTEGKVSTSPELSTRTSLNSSLTTNGLPGKVNYSPGLTTPTSVGQSWTSKEEKKIICYLADWSVNTTDGNSVINHLNNTSATHLCTHIIYAFVHFNDATGKFKNSSKGKYV